MWLINLFIQNNQNIVIDYNDRIIKIIPCLLNYIEILGIDEIGILGTALELINSISDINDIYIRTIVDSNGFNILSIKICDLFNNKKNIIENDDTIDNIIEQLLYAIINIFFLDSKYLKHLDFSDFKTTFEKLLFHYKSNDNNNSNNNDIQNKIVLLLDNLACFEDIEQILQNFLMNKNIVDILFKYYYNCNQNEALLFIDNIMTKQNKKVRDFILDMGGFDIIKNCICNNNENNKEIINICINILSKLIQLEESNKTKEIMDKIYKNDNERIIDEKIRKLGTKIIGRPKEYLLLEKKIKRNL
jgi:hypothetical protein